MAQVAIAYNIHKRRICANSTVGVVVVGSASMYDTPRDSFGSERATKYMNMDVEMSDSEAKR